MFDRYNIMDRFSETIDKDIVGMIFKRNLSEINHPIVYKGIKASIIHHLCLNDRHQALKTVLSIFSIDPNIQMKGGLSIVDIAIQKNDLKMFEIIMKNDRIDWKKGNNKFQYLEDILRLKKLEFLKVAMKNGNIKTIPQKYQAIIDSYGEEWKNIDTKRNILEEEEDETLYLGRKNLDRFLYGDYDDYDDVDERSFANVDLGSGMCWEYCQANLW